MLKPKINKLENEIMISVDSKLYSIDCIYKASYIFIDRAYIYLDGDPDKKVYIYLKGKEKLSSEQLKNLGDEFLNELLKSALRERISKRNQKIREYIVGQALISSVGEEETEEEENWKEDPLGITTPWEEKYGQKKK